jgi:hypothetical protein
MRKINYSIVVTAALLLAAGFVFTACDTGTGGGGGGTGGANVNLNGTTWEQPAQGNNPALRVSFTASTFVCRTYPGNSIASSGTYSVTGNSFSGTITGGQSGIGTFNGTISSNTLNYTSVSTNGGNVSGTMTKI